MRWVKVRQWQQAVVLAGVGMGWSASMRAQQSIADALHAASVSLPMPAAPDDAEAPPASLEDALHSLYRRADVVFIGEVTSIERGAGIVLVRFRVDDGIRGAVAGSTWTLHEWNGLWADDPSRYLVGEHRLMFLHADSAAGYASPVDGPQGAIRLNGDGVQGTADLRWLATEIVVTDEARVRPLLALKASSGSIPVASALLSRASDAMQSFTPDAVSPVDTNAHVDGNVVTGLLHAWQRMEAVQ